MNRIASAHGREFAIEAFMVSSMTVYRTILRAWGNMSGKVDVLDKVDDLLEHPFITPF